MFVVVMAAPAHFLARCCLPKQTVVIHFLSSQKGGRFRKRKKKKERLSLNYYDFATHDKHECGGFLGFFFLVFFWGGGGGGGVFFLCP